MILPFIVLFGFAIFLSVVNSPEPLKKTLKSAIEIGKKKDIGTSPYKNTTIPVECKEDIIICS
ncbi:hypothetical protein MYP_2053 [Sporocytophaga myxococcoides]|uniref:Uncharacterized protein n=2 Tax=Sporocytophaga myxococcoides TaxID=153721 RepID=A0A098LD43_9BACT|nr:hypothetical protein MYP_2053 [Sporocytophaga myxococcoides]